MKFSTTIFVVIFMAISVNGWHQKYGNDFVTYSIGERYEQGAVKNKQRNSERKVIKGLSLLLR
jgi:hypothetical protein